MMRRSLARAYAAIRGHDLPDNIPLAVILGAATPKIIDALRGQIRGTRYRNAQQPHFIARHVSIANPGYVTVGRSVTIGFGSSLQGFSEHGMTLGTGVTIGAMSSLMASAVIREPGVGISIGDGTAIGIRNTIWGQGGVQIGRNCLFGPNVLIVSENHTYSSTDLPIRDQTGKRERVTIGDDCWLGAGVMVMPGVSIGAGCVVGAGSVITRSLPAGSIAHGVPARVLKLRGEE